MRFHGVAKLFLGLFADSAADSLKPSENGSDEPSDTNVTPFVALLVGQGQAHRIRYRTLEEKPLISNHAMKAL